MIGADFLTLQIAIAGVDGKHADLNVRLSVRRYARDTLSLPVTGVD